MSATEILPGTKEAVNRPSLLSQLTGDRWLRWWLIVPTALILIVLSVYPLLYSLYLSLFNLRFNRYTYIGLGNYEHLLGDDAFGGSVRTTLIFAAGVVPVELLLGLGLALLLTEEVRFRTFYRTALIMPMILAPVVVGLIFRLIYSNDFGIPNYIMERMLHLPHVNWLGDPNVSLISIMLMDIWQWTPFMFLVLLAGLQGIPVDLYEAARVDGASYGQSFLRITLPMLRPTILIALLVRTMDALRIFDQVFVTTQGGPGTSTEVVSFYIYKTAFKFTQITYAASLIIVVLLLTLVISTVYIWLLRSQSE